MTCPHEPEDDAIITWMLNPGKLPSDKEIDDQLALSRCLEVVVQRLNVAVADLQEEASPPQFAATKVDTHPEALLSEMPLTKKLCNGARHRQIARLREACYEQDCILRELRERVQTAEHEHTKREHRLTSLTTERDACRERARQLAAQCGQKDAFSDNSDETAQVNNILSRSASKESEVAPVQIVATRQSWPQLPPAGSLSPRALHPTWAATETPVSARVIGSRLVEQCHPGLPRSTSEIVLTGVATTSQAASVPQTARSGNVSVQQTPRPLVRKVRFDNGFQESPRISPTMSPRLSPRILSRVTPKVGARPISGTNVNSELARPMDTFNMIDTNHDGVITREEFEAYARRQAADAVCSCGNVFMPDAMFCRKCGKKRPVDEVALTRQLTGNSATSGNAATLTSLMESETVPISAMANTAAPRWSSPVAPARSLSPKHTVRVPLIGGIY